MQPAPHREDYIQRETRDDPDLAEVVRGMLRASQRSDEWPAHLPRSDSFRRAVDDGWAAPRLEIIGERIGEYRIIEEIGSSFHSRVYLARQESMVHRQVAIKIVCNAAENDHILKRFEVERIALGMMGHPNIVSLYECGTLGRHPYFVMEYIPGRPIDQALKEENTTLEGRIRMMITVCRAVHHAHLRGVIHRDLKPSNVMVMDNEGELIPKIIDFGVARGVDVPLAHSAVRTSEGTLVGTLAYMSPEQVTGESIDIRTDVYALGALLYEIITDESPLGDKNTTLPDLILAITQAPLKPLRVHGLSAQKDMNFILAKAMEKKPSDRYQSAGDLALDLERYLRGDAIHARPRSLLYEARKLAARHRWAAGALALLATVFLAGFVMIAIAQQETKRQEQIARTAIPFLLGSLLDELDRLSGTYERRLQTIEAAVALARPLAETIPEDLENQILYVRTLHALADTKAEPTDVFVVESERREAMKICERMTQRFPNSPEAKYWFSYSGVKIGDLAYHRGDRKEAYRWFEKCFIIDKELVRQNPDNLTYVVLLSWSYERMGSMKKALGRLQEAKAYYLKRLQLMSPLLQSNPSHEEALIAYFDTEIKLFDLHMMQSHYELAKNNMLDARSYAERLNDIMPNNRFSKERLGTAFLKAVQYYMKQREWTSLHESANQALRVFNGIESYDDPSDGNRISHGRFLVLRWIALALRLENRLDEAWAMGMNALQTAQQNVAELPHDTFSQRSIAYAHAGLAMIADKRNERETAVGHALASRKQYENLVAQGDDELWIIKSYVQFLLWEPLGEHRDPVKAIQLLEHYTSSDSFGPIDSLMRYLAKAHDQNGNPARALAIVDDILATGPTNSSLIHLLQKDRAQYEAAIEAQVVQDGSQITFDQPTK